MLHNALHDNASLLRERLRGQLAIFLDYDGTLTPIVSNPEKAIISDTTRDVVRQLCNAFRIAVVSGRSCEKLRQFLKIDGIVLAGSHGLDIRMPPPWSRSMLHPVGEAARTSLVRVQHQLDDTLSDVPGYETEDNTLCISAHYRRVSPEQHARVHEVVHSILQDEPSLRHKEGKMVHELRPAVDWGKGQAVDWLLATFHEEKELQGNQTKLTPLYIGDDVADEDAFKFVEAHGGVGIKVSDTAVTTQDTAASLQITQDEVVILLKLLLDTYTNAER